MKSCLSHKNFFVVVLCASVLGLVPGAANGITINVRADGTGDYSTIQDAIDDCNDGDIIACANGVYTGSGNRDIDFLGKVITVRSASGPNNCIIDCNGTKAEPHRGFYFHNAEDVDSILDGFTITNGFAGSGGAIYCRDSSPMIINCVISGNSATLEGGIFCYSGHLMISDCIIAGNSADSIGGIYCVYGNPTIENSTISGNTARYLAGGIYLSSNADATIRNCTISGNSASTGGGIVCRGEGNQTIVNCIINGNVARYGGGMSCSHDSSPIITNCTVADNAAAKRGGGIDCYQSNPKIKNCILWRNSNSEIYGNVNITYSNVLGGFSGAGNIDSDPLFRDPNDSDYHLLQGSPCIDAGDPRGNYSGQTDIDDEPRIMGCRVDMGADEFTIVNTVPVACIVGGDRAVEVGSDCEARVTLDGSCSSDADSTPGTNDDINDFDWYEVIDPCDPNSDIFLGSGEVIECNLPLGENVIILEVTDKAGAFDANEVTIIVEDTTPPEFTLSVSPDVLWPPNHTMVLITPSWTVSDNCDESLDVTLVSITSNEENDAKGDGHTSDDIQVDDNEIWLRAERSGKRAGRIYTITYQAVDDSNNVAIDSAIVTVPHDQR